MSGVSGDMTGETADPITKAILRQEGVGHLAAEPKTWDVERYLARRGRGASDGPYEDEPEQFGSDDRASGSTSTEPPKGDTE